MTVIPPRKDKDRLEWDDYFMSIAYLVSLRSPDPNTRVGSVLVTNNRIISTGYNGLPCGVDNNDINWQREGNDTKYPYVIHSEVNTILYRQQLPNPNNYYLLYTTLFPCHECAKLISQSGINTVIYGSDKYHNTESSKLAKKIFDKSSITFKQYSIKKQKLLLLLDEIVEL